ncbi:hypothetical protein [Streptomyces sp. N35]|uniref:DUF7660 family protein n=1 Tax=Streptomyces sp. N35 TaxID=2795730 RepID=UPI0018F76C7B|nr:hypothetical protein [Streptomyces sp. N35]
MEALLKADEQLPDREAMVAFLARLREDHARHGSEWENQTLDRFLAALTAWVEACPGWHANFDQVLSPQGDWTLFARALSAARVYE